MFELFKTPIVVKNLKTQVQNLQTTVSILLGDAVMQTTSKGNPYSDYKTAIVELAKKYEGTAVWGNQQVGNIIDVRSAFIIGQGLKLVVDKAEKNSRELEFIEDFIKHNNLDEEMPQELAKEAEIEGRVCVKLIPNLEKKQIDMRFVSYSTNNYTVTSSPDDYQKYIEVKYKPPTTAEVVIPEIEFVYKKFAGRLHKVNDVMPKLQKVLKQCEDLDKALYDYRQANFLFSVPTPYFKCLTKEEVEGTYTKLQATNWKLGKMFVGTAEFSLVEMGGSGLNSLKEEIILLVKVISGATGVPVHFLGLPDLMSNRAVSTDLFEFINASTNKERHIWEGFYEELFDKAIEMANASHRLNLRTGIVKAQILAITEAKMRELSEIWLPLYTAGIVDLDYVLSKIPDADPEQIKKSQEENARKMLESIRATEEEEEEQPEEAGVR